MGFDLKPMDWYGDTYFSCQIVQLETLSRKTGVLPPGTAQVFMQCHALLFYAQMPPES